MKNQGFSSSVNYRYSSMVDCLQSHALYNPQQLALTVVDASGERQFNYRQLDQASRALATRLQQSYQVGDRALILLDNNENYVVAFFACLYAGLIAVPAFPPESLRQQHLSRLLSIVKDAQARCLLASSELEPLFEQSADVFAGADILYVDQVPSELAEQYESHQVKADDIAFLQYTSGSTSAPKGVMVSHGNLVANEAFIEETFAITNSDVMVSWLPLFHDMGLIGSLLQPFYCGLHLVLMSPAFFLERPLRWLQAISKHNGSVSGGPDFAFRLCLQRIKSRDLACLDLSNWRVAFSGSEPIRPDTLELFSQYFANTGFSQSAPYPCYGLAEATLLLAGGEASSGVRVTAFEAESLQKHKVKAAADGQTLVACGFARPSHQLAIFDPETAVPMADHDIGEIWAAGPSIAMGYWQNPEATAKAFVEYQGQRWLRTGDLGFIHQGQLYISARLKDVVILNGQNYYPQDIEQLIEAQLPESRPGRVAAFPVASQHAGGSEGLGIAMELSRKSLRDLSVIEFINRLNQVIASVCHQPAALVLLLNPGALPKTSSGKLQRSACVPGWQQQTLDIYASYHLGQVCSPDMNEVEDVAEQQITTTHELQLAAIWAEVFNCDVTTFRRNSNFLQLGGNSQLATQIASKINRQLGINLAPYQLFEHPQFSALAALISQQSKASDTRQVIKPQPKEQLMPLSSAQQRQWFLWRMQPNSSANHVIACLSLTGELDEATLQQSLDKLIQRHASLRTVFELNESGQVMQKVLNSLSLDITRAKAATDTEIQQIAQSWLEQPFDLIRGPLLRVGLIKTAGQKQHLVLVLQHIITDGWSMGILLNELFAGYGQESQQQQPDISYADYCHWQQQWLASERYQQQLVFWQQLLGSEHPVLQLPTDAKRLAVAEYDEARLTTELPPELCSALRQTAVASQSSVFVLMMTALQALLYRYTGQTDIRVGVPVANRQNDQLQPLTGLFVNTLVFRSEIDNQMSLEQLQEWVRKQAFATQENQQLPFEQLVEVLQPQRSLSHTPLFQVAYNHQRLNWQQKTELAGLSIEQLELPLNKQAQFELALDVIEFENGQLQLRFDYAKQLFKAETIRQLSQHLFILLQQLCTKPEVVLAQVQLTEKQQQEQLQQWSQTPLTVSEPGFIHQRFEQQACNNPDAIALICESQQLSYVDLNDRANQLAHYLLQQQLVTKHGQLKVGIALDRSVDMLVAILAVLKSGATYVPLDPEYPQQRLQHMIQDSGLQLLLTRDKWQGRFESQTSAYLCLSVEGLNLQQMPVTNPGLELHPQQLAYVIYTSGSTGKPKAVAVSQQALSQHIDSALEYIGLQADDCILQFATLNFDSCIEQIFCPLVIGARMLLRGNELWDSVTFHRQLLEHKVSIVDLTTAYWAVLVADYARLKIRDFGRLRQIQVGGEAMSVEILQLWQQHSWGDARLLNVYGPTETLVTATVFDCSNLASSPDIVPIGRPLAGRALHVLDQNLEPVPAGIPGELYIGGQLLAQGYLGRPDLSAERFIADPFSDSGARLYRTGDLVRWSADGQLQYLGRTDEQIKIRGYRIELGEIETCLRQQAGVQEAVVLVEQPNNSNSRLLAYVVASDNTQQAGFDSQLRADLSEQLPEYMLPAVITLVAEIPLTPGGKLDRQALPKPQPLVVEFTSPAAGTEAKLAELWRELLGVEQVARDSNFFEAGGHSLLALQLQSKVQELFNIQLSVMDIFQYPSIRKQAEYIDRQLGHESVNAEQHTNRRQGQEQRANKAKAGFLGRALRKNKAKT